MKVRNLKEEELFGNSKLNIFHGEFRDFIVRSTPTTDFCSYLADGYLVHMYHLDSSNVCINSDECMMIDRYEGKIIDKQKEFGASIRPVIEYNDLEFNVDTLPIRVNSAGIETVKFGFFPQRHVIIRRNEVENMITLPETFSTNSISKGMSSIFKLCKHQAFGNSVFEGLYLECIKDRGSHLFISSSLISNSSTNRGYCGDWFKVEPIEWILDRENHLLISRNILMTGIPYETDKHKVNGNEKFTLNDYLNDIFLPEILAFQPNMKKEYEVSKDKRVAKKYKQTNFDLTEIKEEDMIKGAIESDIPVFLHGKSGDGKSDRVKQIDEDSTIIYMRNATPESLIGKSIVINNELVDIPPTWYLKLVDKCNKEPEKIHVLFFDELTNALPSIQSMAFNIVLDKEVNGKWKLPSNTRIVAAGNEMDDSIAANELAVPLYGRFLHVYIKTDSQKWLKWAIDNNIHPLIITYIAGLKDKVLRTRYTGVEPNADPRKWEMASKVLYQTKNPEMLRELIGDNLTTEFIHFCVSEIITLDDVLNHNYDEDVVFNMNMSLKYATIVGLLDADMEEIDEVYNFVSIMGEEALRLFEVLWSKDNPEKLEYLLLKKQEKKLVKK